MSVDNHYLSREKYEELKVELSNLKTIERKKIAESLEYATSLGDLSENAEYHEARDRQADVEDRIANLEVILKNAKIISTRHSDLVEVGAIVTMEKSGGQQEDFQIVGPEEADLLNNKISYESPLGSALLGHKKGETIKVNTPRGEIRYKIIEIK